MPVEPPQVPALKRQEYDVDVEARVQAQKQRDGDSVNSPRPMHVDDVEVDQYLLQPLAEDTLTDEAKERQKDRIRIFHVVNLPEKMPPASDMRPKGTKELARFQPVEIYVEPVELRFDAFFQLEPHFLTMAVYDIKARERVTECFSVDVNDYDARQMLKIGPCGSSNGGNKAIFELPEASPNYVLVIRVEKTLVGDLETATEIYQKCGVKAKAKEKFRVLMQDALERLQPYRQSMGLMMVPLFDTNTARLHTEIRETMIIGKTVRMGGDLTDENVFKQTKTLLSDKDLSKLKPYPAKLSVKIGPPEKVYEGRETPSLVLVKPKLKSPDPVDVIREIQTFYHERQAVVPNFEWVHTLYFYPTLCNMTGYAGKGNARNLALHIVLKDNDALPTAEGSLKDIYGYAREPNFVASRVTSVKYHEQKASFFEEVKIRLPSHIGPEHHLFITVMHVQCKQQNKKSKGDAVATPVAYAWIPLTEDVGRFVIEDGEHGVPTAYTLPKGYTNPVNEDQIKWFDKEKKKPNLFFSTRLVSTIFSTNSAVQEFFNQYHSWQDSPRFVDSINNLRDLSPELLIKWLPILLTNLVKIQCNFSNNTTLPAFQTMICIINQIAKYTLTADQSPSTRIPIMVNYISYFFDIPSQAVKPFHDEALHNLVFCLEQRNEEMTQMILNYSWAIFDMIFKGMIRFLFKQDKLQQDNDRGGRFLGEFYNDLYQLLKASIVEMQNQEPAMVRSYNRNLALFLKDLLAICDRGLIMDLIYFFVEGLPVPLLKYNALQVLCDHEHFVQLNLPLPDTIDDIPGLEKRLWRNHFLAGVLINEIFGTLQSFPPEMTDQTSASYRKMAVDTIYFQLLKHDQDPRYQQSLCRRCIAGCYFMFILRFIEAQQDYYLLLNIKGVERMRLLTCFMWIVGNVTKKLLHQWWMKETERRVTSFFLILYNCLGAFEYGVVGEEQQAALLVVNEGKTSKTDDEGKILKGGTLRKKILRNRPLLKDTGSMTKSQNLSAAERVKEANLCREVSMTALDILMQFMVDFETQLQQQGNPYMKKIVVNMFMMMLSNNQAHSFLSCLFKSLKYLIVTFREPMFLHVTPYCSDITYEVLRYCNSPSPPIRNQAAGLFYLLLKTNFETVGNFSRMKLQSTIGVNGLEQEGIARAPERFQASLRAVAEFAQTDADMPREFSTQVTDLTERLFTVLRDSIKINSYSYDPEMTADLYYQVSKGYVASPDLRASWLSTLSRYHEEKENWEEAAQCRIHLASLISVYINKLKPSEQVQCGKKQFQRAAPNVDSEMNIPPEAFREEGICQSSTFTRTGLFMSLKAAVDFLKKDMLYESCIAVLRMMVAIHSANRNWEELQDVYEDLESLCKLIVETNAADSRMFSVYFKVTFMGRKFKELDGQEYIYKERPGARHAEVAERIKLQYEEKFGADRVFVLGNRFKSESLNLQENVYIQILGVDPYLDAEDMELRRSPFERRFNLSRFIFEAPFTASGKAHSDDIREQQKKKTIMTTENPFPYVIKRLKVVDKTELVLSPIQTSMELIEGRCRLLANEINQHPPNSKTLQIVLQGSVLLQVNVGPTAICSTFLSEREKYPAEDVEQLEECIQRFVGLCGEAVLLNKRIIEPAQMLFHEQLEKGYASLVELVKEHMDIA
eukprot:TRINITY_DN7381_c0_g1_i1.p1 TRINITY_DN7381_c0_g1~~TRINITY_DN7381_c0_g1_i1.p1  ORF type:complete len:1788 (-),score=632.22 TRINITY_DN7381_c0_g1_i1:302-5233(-)